MDDIFIGAVRPTEPIICGPIVVELERDGDGDTIWLSQAEDGNHDFICIEVAKIDELVALLVEAKTLSAGHGAQGGASPGAPPDGEPATARDEVHETPGRQTISFAGFERLLAYIEAQSGISRKSHRAEVLAIFEEGRS